VSKFEGSLYNNTEIKKGDNRQGGAGGKQTIQCLDQRAVTVAVVCNMWKSCFIS